MSDAGRAGLPRAFFLPTPTGQRFCMFHPAQGSRLQGSVLYLHPFAEELNTTRRVVAQQARAMAEAGFAVLQIDLLGCGDSEGEFADATWEAWLEDAHRAYDWLAEHAPGPVWLWGMRSGTLLATALAASLPRPAHLLLWQPVINGQQMLQQFLRLHAAGQWLTDGNKDLSKDTTPAQALASGASVDIAGYTLSPALAQGLSAVRMQAPPAMPAHLIWIDTSTQPEPALSPAASTHLDTWRKAGWSVNAQAINSPAFWQTIGTDEAPALLAATLQALKGCGESAE